MRRVGTGDQGFTLVEVLIALIVLGIGVAALLTALGMNAKTSFANRSQAEADTALTTEAEYVKSFPFDAKNNGCGLIQDADLQPKAPNLPSGYTVTFSNVTTTTFGTGTACELQAIQIEIKGFNYDLTATVSKRADVEATP